VLTIHARGCTIANTMAVDKRGSAMAIWVVGLLLGPVIGPVCGGFLAQAEAWRWMFWVIAVTSGVLTIIGVFVPIVIYAPILLERKAKRRRKETGNRKLRSGLAIDAAPKALFVQAITQPTKLILLSPICALMTLYMALVYAIV
jgi:MFS family permease